MRTEKVLWSTTILCALFLLTAPMFGGRAVWANRGGGMIRDAAGWDWLLPILGVVAIVGLVVCVFTRPRVVIPVLGAAIATAAFAVAAYSAGSFGLAIVENRVQPGGFVFGRDEPYRVLAAPSPQPYTVVATVAAGFALVLAVSWLRPAEDEW